MSHNSADECTESTFTKLDFIADLLYQRHAREVQNYATGVRWWCHRPDSDNGRVRWRREAADAYMAWAKSERETKEQQDAKYPPEVVYREPPASCSYCGVAYVPGARHWSGCKVNPGGVALR